MAGNGLNFGTRPETLRKAVAATRSCSICGKPVRASMVARHEQAHRSADETKPCKECGMTMRRVPRQGQTVWDEKRFCSPTCNGRWHGARKRRLLTESYVVMPSGCWEWNRSIGPEGYGKARSRQHRGTIAAHRMVWTEMVGPIPEGMTLDHLCRNPPCVNPAHLEPVTLAENIRRAAAVRTHCKYGHILDGKRPTHRYCLTCHSENQRRYLARKEAARVLAA